MSQPETNRVKCIRELRLPPGTVIEYINKGWRLLNTVVEGVASHHEPSQSRVYVLGWTGEGEPPK